MSCSFVRLMNNFCIISVCMLDGFVYSFPVNSGTALNKSATSPWSATWKIGASGSLLMATMVLESFMPAKCWMAPEMPTAM